MSASIFDNFEPISAKAWKQKIQFELLGKDYNETLLTNTNEGIIIKPFYHLDDFEKLTIPVTTNSFKICQKIIITSEAEANKLAVQAIKNGANSLKFETDKPFNSELLFENLIAKNIDFHFHFHFLSEDFINSLLEFLKNETTFLNIDIVGDLVKTGNWYTSLIKDFSILEHLIQKNNSAFLISVNANIYQNAGANCVQQIAYALAHANEYLNKFGGKIGANIQFNFALGNNFFFEISKIRAFKYLYQLVLNEYEESGNVTIFCEPSFRNKTINSETNLYKTYNESWSAILGGSNTISTNLYTPDFENSDEFEQKITQEQFKFLKENQNFNSQHIATNAYYIEAITKQLAEKALLLFKEIEKSGGFLHQLKEGTIQRKIKENAQKEQLEFNALQLNSPNSQPTSKTLKVKSVQKQKGKKTLFIPITSKRLAETIELKHLKNEA
jgi:methylmalonyl-CoA mutase